MPSSTSTPQAIQSVFDDSTRGVLFGRTQFKGSSFPNSGIDPSLPIPASLCNGQGEPVSSSTDLKRVKICFFGEALGETEEKKGRPFVGSTGTDLRLFAKQAGFMAVQRGFFKETPFFELPWVYIDNVIKIRPLDNSLSNLPPGSLEFWTGVLIKQLQCGVLRPNVIVAIGKLAVSTLCGKHYEKITHWRGSILPTQFDGPDGKPFKVIPCLHPSYIQKNWKKRYQLIHDLKLVLKEMNSPEITKPQYSMIINPSLSQIREFVKRAGAEAPIGLDYPEAELVEDPYPSHIMYHDYETAPPFIRSLAVCTSVHPKEAICIPFTHANLTDYWDDPAQEEEVWRLADRLLGLPYAKCGQNYLTYDLFYSRWYGLHCRRLWLDTLYGHKTLQPELPASLEALTSIYTYPVQNFYKEEGKVEHRTYSEEQFWNYNCLDVLVLPQISTKIRDELVERGLWRVYIESYQRRHKFLLNMAMRGVRWNTALREELAQVYAWLRQGLQSEVDQLVGHPLNTSSPPQMMKFMYGELKMIPVFIGRGEKKRRTSNKMAVIKCRKRYAKYAKTLTTILKLKTVRDRESDNLNCRIDADGRIRASFTMNPETGRLSSKECPLGSGRNMQNFERPE
jgi:uracil-DNA glycosylase family 4